MGLGTPRSPIQLVERGGLVRLEQIASRRDLTESMRDAVSGTIAELADGGLSGYIFKSRSPSCGLDDVPVHAADGTVLRSGTGLYAGDFLRSFGDLPVEDEIRLEDEATRDHFLTRVFARHRLEALGARRGREDLSRFHRRESFLLFVHDPEGAAELDGAVNQSSSRESDLESYTERFLRIVRKPARKSRHAEALRRLVACLEGLLAPPEADTVLAEIDAFECGKAPRSIPSASIHRLAVRYERASVYTQTYLAPHPLAMREL